ncbi:amidohydrolase family protein [Plastoroseomonas hellenica]|uniref:hypothetical protein n=1 Tax=Plastoroseomonas hellenica TaxID=2687306 RepID=UPI001BA7A283|nr:hypothetical protein [Plastoroseomonas hellenica]MBR0643778.1 hypothetical protein [Plastoroseomonas hellenica]
MPRPPSDYLRRFTCDTIAHSPEILRWAISQIGIDRVVLGSDDTFDMRHARPLEILEQILRLPAKIPAETIAR